MTSSAAFVRRSVPRRARVAEILLLTLLAGCVGSFQRTKPDVVDSYARTASGVLEVGAAEVDITPDRDLYLGGFDLGRTSTGIHSRLKVRAMVLAMDDMKVAIVGVDSLGLMRQDADWIKRRLYGFRAGDVFICSSHTHHAPDPIGFWGYYLLTTGRDDDYLRQVRDGVAEAVRQATAVARPATLRLGQSRTPGTGLFRNSNRAGVFDRRLTVVQAVDRESEEPIGAILHAACHPEVLRRRNTLVSADFVGDLCERWRDAELGQPVFVNGAIGGLVSSALTGPDNLPVVGERLFDLMSGSLETARVLDVDEIEVRRRDVFTPLESVGLAAGRLTTALPRELYEGDLQTGVGYLRLGDFEALAMPGEAEPGYVARIRALTGRPNMVLFGLCDDEVGYIMSERDARTELFSYERTMSPGPTAGEAMLDAIVGTLRSSR